MHGDKTGWKDVRLSWWFDPRPTAKLNLELI